MFGPRARWCSDLLRHQSAGRTATLRRSNNLQPYTVSVATATPASSTTLILKPATGTTLQGRIVKGSKFTIPGDSRTFTVVEDTVAASNRITVAFDLGLASDIAIGTAATFTQPYSETDYPCLVRQISDTDNKFLVAGGESIRVLPYDPDKPAPELNDRLDGVAIVKVDEIPADDGIGGYVCRIDSGKVA